MKEEKKTKEYLKGYKDGFESALKMAWAYAEEQLISADNVAKPDIEQLIEKLSQ